jgi:hypothetical protein
MKYRFVVPLASFQLKSWRRRFCVTHAVELVDSSVNFAVRVLPIETEVESERPVVVSVQLYCGTYAWSGRILFLSYRVTANRSLHCSVLLSLLLSLAVQPSTLWVRPPRSRRFLITHNYAPQSVGLLWTSDKLVAETCTWPHTTHTTDKHICPRWDSNPRSQ